MEVKILKVLYNNECPVCSLEIHHYKNYTQKEDIHIEFEDLNITDLQKWGISKDEAMRRLYLIESDKLYSGIDAFIVLWKRMPKYKWLAKLFSRKIIYKIACFSYDNIISPVLYRINKKT